MIKSWLFQGNPKYYKIRPAGCPTCRFYTWLF